MKRKICIFTGTRAEYGLLRWLMEDIRDSSDLELQIIATGTHLSPEFGLTHREIERDGFVVDSKVEMLLSSDTSAAVVKSMGLGLIGYADAFERLKPDIVVLLGDRYELLAAAAAALIQRIPIAHLHGGEITEGAFDDSIRHAITKMAHLHFVACQEYGNRVIQMGEDPARVFLVGGLGVDAIKRTPLMDRATLEASLGFTFRRRNLLVTYHPVTAADVDSTAEMGELLAALDQLDDTTILLTLPNADTGGRGLGHQLKAFATTHANAHCFTSLGQVRYLSCLKQVDGVVGNSSSGLTEAPSFGIGTINIGERQNGRQKAVSVLDCPAKKGAILQALGTLYSAEFQGKLAGGIENPYGNGGASDKIARVLRECSLGTILHKSFVTLPLHFEGTLQEQ